MVTNIRKWEGRIMDKLRLQDFTDGSHDLSHFKRVADRALQFNTMHGNPLVILAAGLLHDMVQVPKNSPDRNKASFLSAEAAVQLLQSIEFPDELLRDVHHAVLAHSHSAQITPVTIEAKCVQDADRIEALGALGIARCFYVSARIGADLVDWRDPWAKRRRLNDKKWALDHFEVKLLKVIDTMHTKEGKIIGESLCSFMREYRSRLIKEGIVSPEYQVALICSRAGKDSISFNGDAKTVTLEEMLTKESLDNPGMKYFVEQLRQELGKCQIQNQRCS